MKIEDVKKREEGSCEEEGRWKGNMKDVKKEGEEVVIRKEGEDRGYERGRIWKV